MLQHLAYFWRENNGRLSSRGHANCPGKDEKFRVCKSALPKGSALLFFQKKGVPVCQRTLAAVAPPGSHRRGLFLFLGKAASLSMKAHLLSCRRRQKRLPSSKTSQRVLSSLLVPMKTTSFAPLPFLILLTPFLLRIAFWLLMAARNRASFFPETGVLVFISPPFWASRKNGDPVNVSI